MKRKCKTCKVPKEKNEFYDDRSRVGLKRTECKACMRDKAREKAREKKANQILFY